MTDVPLPEMPPGPSAEEIILIGLRKRYHELQVQSLEIEREAKAIKERARRLGRGVHPIGDGTVTISRNATFDPKRAAEVLRAIHPDLVSKCSISHVDSKLTKQFVSGEVYEQCQKESDEDKVVFS